MYQRVIFFMICVLPRSDPDGPTSPLRRSHRRKDSTNPKSRRNSVAGEGRSGAHPAAAVGPAPNRGTSCVVTSRRRRWNRSGCRKTPPWSMARSALTSATRAGWTRVVSRTSRLPHVAENFAPVHGCPGAAAVRCSATCRAASGHSGTVRPTARSWPVSSWRAEDEELRAGQAAGDRAAHRPGKRIRRRHARHQCPRGPRALAGRVQQHRRPKGAENNVSGGIAAHSERKPKNSDNDTREKGRLPSGEAARPFSLCSAAPLPGPREAEQHRRP